LSILGRLFYIQIIWGNNLQIKAIDQWTRELPLVAKRGVITDRNGVILADNNQTYSVFIRARSVTNASEVATVLSLTLGIDKDEIYSKITKTANSVITVKKRVDKVEIEKLRQYTLQGVYYCPDYTRVYPYGKSLSQVLGYTSNDGVGSTGLEKIYDQYLRGYDGEILYEADLVGKDINNKNASYFYMDVRNGLSSYKNFDDNTVYQIAVIDYVFEGTYYSEFKKLSASDYIETDIILRDQLIYYIDNKY
jgi:stage V sporulation protein D (sporulation-specific penicillin-binding protein)